MKNVLLYALIMLASGVLTWQCQDTPPQTETDVAIPALLERSAGIGPDGELAQIRSMYRELVSKVRADPNDLNARLNLAELLMQEARISGEHGHYYPGILTLLETVVTEKPNPAQKYRALVDKASVQMSLHQFEAARATATEAVQINPNEASIYGVLVDANVELGHYEQAVEMADKMVSIRPDIRSYSRISYLREIYGQVTGAIDAMKLAVSAGYPGMEQTEWARLNLGQLYLRYGMIDSARLQFQLALSARPNYPFAIAAMAGLEALQGRQAEADRLMDQACALIPEVGFFVEKAKWEKEKGNAKGSGALTKEILAMLADDEQSGHMMGLEYARVYLDLLGDPQKALEYALTEYRTRPDNIDVNRSLATIYYHSGNIKLAGEHLQKAMRTHSRSPELTCLEGLIKAKSGKVSDGRILIRKAFTANLYLECSFCNEAKAL
ncbi:MAG: hypothetical protein KDC65_07335 [Saprospiraceae bacterium]|nr:hypothetical protein [Saprospiraceae bacterium]